MKIHSFSTIVASPFIITAGIILYFLFFEDQDSLYPYLIPLAAIIAGIYAFHPKIDFWWHQKHAPELPVRIKKMVYSASPFYQDLDESGQRRFLDRLAVFMHHKAYYIMLQEKEAMPEDMKALIALCAVTVTYNDDEYFFPKYDYFIAYQHPFPTPIKKPLHSVELNHEDGLMLFNSEHLYQSMIAKSGAFNLGIYAFAEAYLITKPLSDLAQAIDPDPSLMPEKGPYSLESIIMQIGYKEIYFKAVLIALYFEKRNLLETAYPAFNQLCSIAFNNQGRSLS